MSSFVHNGNQEKNILILGKGPTQRIDDVTLTAGKEYPISFTEQHNELCLSLDCNEANGYVFTNGFQNL